MNRHDKWHQYLMAVSLCLFIGGMAALSILTPKKAFSESENRTLEQPPAFSMEKLIRGRFASVFERYLSDQFAFRDFWIGVKSDVDRALGKKENHDVYLGKDGYLIQKWIRPKAGEAEKKADALNRFDRAVPDLPKYLMLVPTAVSVLEQKLPEYVSGEEQLQYLDMVRKQLNPDIRYVDVYPALHANRSANIFYKTDHHWTTKGAYLAYRVLAEQMGFVPKEESEYRIEQVTGEFYGSLSSKSGFRHLQPDSISIYIPKHGETLQVEYADEQKSAKSLYERENLKKKDKYTVFLNGNRALIKIATRHPEGKKLLVVKDSYANSFLPFLTAHFSEIYVVDLRYYEDDLRMLIKSNHIDEMLILYNANTFFEDPSIQSLAESDEEE
ncbi:DHHW family protein [Brevibacillus sp. B_LB10_24]|uniref:DHHW family protein n=1 Tax=Brevibacillus sp. B_LB10_24 TaxID=3380645 RepID=UPI0038BCA30F